MLCEDNECLICTAENVSVVESQNRNSLPLNTETETDTSTESSMELAICINSPSKFSTQSNTKSYATTVITLKDGMVYAHIKRTKSPRNFGDITKINAEELPDFDCLVGGFPCQAFSIAGKRGGFDDTRGTLFFDLARILKAKQPRLFVFENVKGLLSHDQGNTFRTIIATIDELGYDCQWQVVNSKNFGVPQNRERIIIVGHLRGTSRPQVFPIGYGNGETANPATGKGTIVDLSFRADGGYKVRKDERAGTLDANYYKGIANQERPGVVVGTLRTHKDGNGFRATKSGIAPTIPARAREDGSGQPVAMMAMRWVRTEKGKEMRREAMKNGRDYTPFSGDARTLEPSDSGIIGTITAQAISKDSLLGDGVKIRRLTPKECERLQAFPDDWTKYGVFDEVKPVSDTQRYKMCGNAVTTNVIQAVFERIFQLEEEKS